MLRRTKFRAPKLTNDRERYRVILKFTWKICFFVVHRLHRLEEIAQHWEGPMSLAVYVTDREASLLVECIDSSPLLSRRRNILIHLVFQEGVSAPHQAIHQISEKIARVWILFVLFSEILSNQRAQKYRHEVRRHRIRFYWRLWFHPESWDLPSSCSDSDEGKHLIVEIGLLINALDIFLLPPKSNYVLELTYIFPFTIFFLSSIRRYFHFLKTHVVNFLYLAQF